MDVSIRYDAVEAARDLLRRFKADHPAWQDDQTPVEQMALWLGCEVATFHPDDYPGGTYGFLEPGEQLIWLCRDLTPTLRRFTLAHELGHVLLHSHIPVIHDLPARSPGRSFTPPAPSAVADACQGLDVQDAFPELPVLQQAEELLGPGAVYDPRSQRELAANLFAAELLMPQERLWELYVEQGQTPDDLAALFAVSQAALLNRLAGFLGAAPAQPEPVDLPLVVAPPTEGASSAAPQHLSPRAYDAFQQAAIEAPTPALIVAGPGSGKTSTLIGRADYLLVQQGVPPEQILALTFSRKAAQEMQERLQKILPPGLPSPTVSTFHAFCAELLRTHGLLVGLRQNFELMDDASGYFLLHGLASSLPLRSYQNLHNPAAPFLAFLQAISRARDELVTPARYRELASSMLAQAADEEELEAATRALEVAAVYELYQQALEQRGDTDFGGLIMLAVQLLQTSRPLRAELEQRYQHILVDEFQDINRASGVLLRLLAGEKQQVWVVGDANQAIYGFRGASPANIHQFHQDYPLARVLPLNRNYRSRPDIVHLADTFRSGVLEQNPGLDPVQTARVTEPEAYVTLAVAPDDVSELRSLVLDIQAKLRSGYTSHDIVVLCRTRAMVRKVVHALAQAELPVDDRGSFLEQEHVRNILSLLLLLGEESGMGLLRVTHLPDHTLSQADLEALLRQAYEQRIAPMTLLLRGDLSADISRTGVQTLARLTTIVKNLYHAGESVWLVLARYLLGETSLVRDLLKAEERAQVRVMRDDYARLLQYAHAYDLQSQTLFQQAEERARLQGDEPPLPPDLKAQIQGFLEYFQILLSLRQQSETSREKSSEEADETPALLRVMTVHASKGLEFPVVYLPGLAQRRFPLQKRSDPMPPPIGMLPLESDAERTHESGEACLFYVGTTRARDQLILSYSERYGKQSAKRSGYIDALVVGLPQERVRRVLWQGEKSGDTPQTGQATVPATIPQPSQAFVAAMQSSKLRARPLEDYQICPRRYAYSSIYHFQSGEGAFLPFWQATSETVKALAERLQAADAVETTLTREQVAELFHHHWHAQGGDVGPFAHLYAEHGQEIAEQIWRKLQDQQAGSWQLRRNLSVELAGRTIEVSIDRVETSADEQQPDRFVRTRIGKSKSKPAPGTRELLYLHAGRQHRTGQDVSLASHNLSTGAVEPVKITARKEASLLTALEQTITGIEKQDYAPHPDAFVCPSCPFYLICPA